MTTRPITLRADPATHATDRVVIRDGECVGRVMRIEHGPQDGRWQWLGLWVGVDNRGVVGSLQEGLAAVRATASRQAANAGAASATTSRPK